MFNLKKETTKKNIFLTISIISLFILVAGAMCTIMKDNSPVEILINGNQVRLVVIPALVFIVTFALYRNSKKTIKLNAK